MRTRSEAMTESLADRRLTRWGALGDDGILMARMKCTYVPIRTLLNPLTVAPARSMR